LKLDELIRAVNHARNEMINIEKLSDEELAQLSKKYETLRHEFELRQERKKKAS
jgi:low affinity Fe/Cu permease